MNEILIFALVFIALAVTITVSSMNINYLNNTLENATGEAKHEGTFLHDLNIGVLAISVVSTLVSGYLAYEHFTSPAGTSLIDTLKNPFKSNNNNTTSFVTLPPTAPAYSRSSTTTTVEPIRNTWPQ